MLKAITYGITSILVAGIFSIVLLFPRDPVKFIYGSSTVALVIVLATTLQNIILINLKN